ncbi:MAG TPA: VWA domain-containing protein [Bryobacteraceae bacterium]
MFFLNLSAAEFFALFGMLGGLTAALYLLDRTKRKKVVSTLRFWAAARTAEEQQSRRRMHEPWSLALQLLGLLFLLLAIAQLQWGSRQSRGHDHVLLLDTSAWSAGQSGNGTLLDREKSLTRRYLSTLRPIDRVMLVRADSMATPVTSFTSNRAAVLDALNRSVSAFSSLNLEQALSLAKQAQGWSGGEPGEIVYVGPARLGEELGSPPVIPNLRTILVEPDRENVGIRHLAVKRGEEDSNSWQATVMLKNYGSTPHAVRLRTQFAGTVFAARPLNLAPGEETSAEYNFVTNTAGELIAAIEPRDTLPIDDRAVLRLPKNGPLRVAVFTRRPGVLGPLLEANHRLRVAYYSASQYSAGLAASVAADVIVIDQFGASPLAATQPRVATLWIDPPPQDSPLPVERVVPGAVVKNWHDDTTLGAGLRAKEAQLASAEVFKTSQSDSPVATIAEGPIVVARPADPSHPKLAVIGFDPLNGELKFEVTTPLLFANLLRWLSPEAFRTLDLSAGRVGAVNVTLDPGERAGRIRVSNDRGFAVPFTIHSQTLELFAGRPGEIRVFSDERERVLSLTLPDVADVEWKPPAGAARDVPAAANFGRGAIDLWKWLALCGAACLLIEWFLFGRRRPVRIRTPIQPRRPTGKPEPAKTGKLVSK